jgi:hypothetical protein
MILNILPRRTGKTIGSTLQSIGRKQEEKRSSFWTSCSIPTSIGTIKLLNSSALHSVQAMTLLPLALTSETTKKAYILSPKPQGIENSSKLETRVDQTSLKMLMTWFFPHKARCSFLNPKIIDPASS